MHRIFEIIIAAFWAGFCAWAAVPAGTHEKTITGMAAKVAGQVVTVREGRFFLALQRFKDGKDPFAAETPGELRGAVQRLLLEEMVFAELKSLKFEAGSRAEALELLKNAKKKADPKVWQRLVKTYGKSESAIADRIWKSLQVEKFIQRRVETMTPIVTSAEIDRYIRSKAQDRRIDEKELQRLRPEAAQELKKDLMRKELEEWIVLLKKKYSVANYLES